MSSSVSLIEVCQTYDPERSPAQTALLAWLDTQLQNPLRVPSAVLAEFSRLWHQTTDLQPPAIDFRTVCQTYRQERESPSGVGPHREAALFWLEQQLLSEAPTLLATFGHAWQQPEQIDMTTLTIPATATVAPPLAAALLSKGPIGGPRGESSNNLVPSLDSEETGAGELRYPPLAIGSQDTAAADGPVHQLQRLLKYKFGYVWVAVNGEFDPITEQAVRDLQLKRFGAAQVSGRVDDRTWQALLDEACDRWLASPDPLVNGEVDLVEVARYFRLDSPETYSSYHRRDAIRWLESQVSATVANEFAQRYRGETHDPQVPLDWVSAFAYYKDLPHQAAALQWLQAQIPASIRQDFAAYWRNPHLYPPDRATRPPSLLRAATADPVSALASAASAQPLNLLRAYQQTHAIVTPEQQAALEWLQAQVPAAVLQEFAHLWSADDETSPSNLSP